MENRRATEASLPPYLENSWGNPSQLSSPYIMYLLYHNVRRAPSRHDLPSSPWRIVWLPRSTSTSPHPSFLLLYRMLQHNYRSGKSKTPYQHDYISIRCIHSVGPPYAESTSASELPKPRTGSLSSHRAPRTSVSVSVGGSHRATPRTSIDTRQPLPPQRLAPAADSAPSSSSPSTSGSGTNSSGKKATRSSPAAPTTPVHNERRRRGRSMDAKGAIHFSGNSENESEVADTCALHWAQDMNLPDKWRTHRCTQRLLAQIMLIAFEPCHARPIPLQSAGRYIVKHNINVVLFPIAWL